MKKSDLILELAKDLNLSQKKATDVVDFIFEKMRNLGPFMLKITNQERVEIPKLERLLLSHPRDYHSSRWVKS